jgi:hypothetical protein
MVHISEKSKGVCFREQLAPGVPQNQLHSVLVPMWAVLCEGVARWPQDPPALPSAGLSNPRGTHPWTSGCDKALVSDWLGPECALDLDGVNPLCIPWTESKRGSSQRKLEC